MSEFERPGQFLSGTAASAAVTSLGWRYVLGVAQATVQAGSLAEAARSAAEDRRGLAKHVLPALGALKLNAIGSDDLRRFHLALRETPIGAN